MTNRDNRSGLALRQLRFATLGELDHGCEDGKNEVGLGLRRGVERPRRRCVLPHCLQSTRDRPLVGSIQSWEKSSEVLLNSTGAVAPGRKLLNSFLDPDV